MWCCGSAGQARMGYALAKVLPGAVGAGQDWHLLGEVTGDRVPLPPVGQRGLLGGTDALRLPAAGAEPAAGRRWPR